MTNRKQRRAAASVARRNKGAIVSLPQESLDQMKARYGQLAQQCLDLGIQEMAVKMALIQLSQKIQEAEASQPKEQADVSQDASQVSTNPA